jgi:hypothetical protein
MISEFTVMEFDMMDGTNYVADAMLLENGDWVLCRSHDTGDEHLIPRHRIKRLSVLE